MSSLLDSRLPAKLVSYVKSHPALTTSMVLSASIAINLLYRDYQDYLALGPGGLPFVSRHPTSTTAPQHQAPSRRTS
jgi:hypothetical protein